MRPSRPDGFAFSNAEYFASFAILTLFGGNVPGAMILAVMPFVPNSTANALVNPQTACFATETAEAPG